jgi:AAA15 family ATPase/GTPase
MLKRFYADNYKCLVNFELNLGSIQLLLGQNGSGKSTVGNVLMDLRSLIIDGVETVKVFPTSSLTRWQMLSKQVFRLEVEREHSLYIYQLELEHDRDKQTCKITKEELTYDSKTIYLFEDSDVNLFNDRFVRGATFGGASSRSFISSIEARHDNTHLTWFKRWVSYLYYIQIDPTSMTGRSESEDERPNIQMTNFASWYRSVQAEQPDKMASLYESLRDVIDGFQSLPITQYGENVRMLKMKVKTPGSREGLEYAFSELSHGQRNLIALYAVLHFTVGSGITLVMDEPDNFVALREIQPWIASMNDLCEEHPGFQLLLISHHPEIINYLAPEHAINFVRDGAGPARTEPFAVDTDGLTPAELVARGWESG